MVTQLKKQARRSASQVLSRKQKAESKREEERILQQATLELITKHGGLFVATGVRELRVKDLPVWVITVTMRYPTGFEGYVGDLLYDGETFTFLTEQSVIEERVKTIANDPERLRKWNEYRSSTLRSRKG